jgi:hypothetical protein
MENASLVLLYVYLTTATAVCSVCLQTLCSSKDILSTVEIMWIIELFNDFYLIKRFVIKYGSMCYILPCGGRD